MKKMKEIKREVPAEGLIFLEYDKVYVIEKGKFILRERLGNGKTISHDHPIIPGEVIGWPTLFMRKYAGDEVLLDNIELEMEALLPGEVTIIHSEDFLENHVPENSSRDLLEGMISTLQKRRVAHTAYHAVDRKGYVLTVMRRFADREGHLTKAILNPELFNMSKSHFYLIIDQLKKEGYLQKLDKIYKINHEKAMEYQLDVIEMGDL